RNDGGGEEVPQGNRGADHSIPHPVHRRGGPPFQARRGAASGIVDWRAVLLGFSQAICEPVPKPGPQLASRPANSSPTSTKGRPKPRRPFLHALPASSPADGESTLVGPEAAMSRLAWAECPA